MVYPFCSSCRGKKLLCGEQKCPLLESVRRRVPPVELGGRTVDGPSPPSVFVGRFGYPKISIGPLAPPIAVPMPERLERPSYLYGLDVERIYSIRSTLIRGKHKLDVKLASDPRILGSEPLYKVEGSLPIRGRKILTSVQELSLSTRSLDTEMTSVRELGLLKEHRTLDSITMPMGPSIDLAGLRIIDNASVERSVDRYTSDTDILASDAAVELYGTGIPLEHVTRLLSVGLLGEGKRRKLVPTRWSITAVDDILSKSAIDGLRDLPPLDTYHLYEGHALGNHFLIALFPPPFRFEMMEQWQQGSLWGGGRVITDHEGPKGRKDYASSITGAYYSARLSVAEHLHSIGRTAGAAVIRWITDEYWAPLGVWVIRESVKRAFQNKPMIFEDRESLKKGIDRISGINDWRSHTRFLSRMIDRRIDDFIS